MEARGPSRTSRRLRHPQIAVDDPHLPRRRDHPRFRFSEKRIGDAEPVPIHPSRYEYRLLVDIVQPFIDGYIKQDNYREEMATITVQYDKGALPQSVQLFSSQPLS